MVGLNPTEVDRLQVFLAAELARRTRALGLKLNAPEAVALIADEMHLAARAGKAYGEVREAGLTAVAAEEVLDGVPEIVAEVRVEVLLEEGTRLVVARDPIRARESGMRGGGEAETRRQEDAETRGGGEAETRRQEDAERRGGGDAERRRPEITFEDDEGAAVPGEERIGAVRLAEGEIPLWEGRARIRLVVENGSQRVVRVGSHFPFWRANCRLRFDREAARGYHLAVPAGSHVRWAPGEVREVELVALGGEGGEP